MRFLKKERRGRRNAARPDLSTGQLAGDWDGPEFMDAPEPIGERLPPWGPRRRFAGRYGAVTAGVGFSGPTTQLCGLFPFVVGSGSPQHGVPLGHHLSEQETVYYSPFEWVRRGLTTNPGAFVIGAPGVGKSALNKRLIVGLAAQGVRPLILGDVKPDYPGVIEAIGGQVLTLGRGHDTLNPLDPGPIHEAARRLNKAGKHKAAAGLMEEAHARRLALLVALCSIGRNGGNVTPAEQVILAAALQHSEDIGRQLSLHSLVDLLRDPPAEVMRDAVAGDHLPVVQTLGLMVTGPLRGVFSAETSTAIDLDAPGVELDLSPLSMGGDPTAIAAGMLAVWGHSLGMVDASLALAEHGLEPGREYFAIMDELWRSLRGSELLVDKIDALTRVNRARGMAQMMSTHSLRDLASLESAAAKAKALGFVERSATVFVGAVPPGEADALADVLGLSRKEKELVSSWMGNGSWDGTSAHPGRGKFLVKTVGRFGIPIQVDLTPAEMVLYDTDYHAASVADVDDGLYRIAKPLLAGAVA